MSTKEAIKNKVAKAKAQAETNPKPLNDNTKSFGTFMTMSEINFWLGEGFRRQKFDSQIIDMNEIFKEKLQYLVHSKPYIIELDQDKDGDIDEEDKESPASDEVKKFITALRIQQVMFANEGNVWDHGRGYIIIYKKPNGEPGLRLAEPGFPNVVVRLGDIAISADVYTPFLFNRVKYYMRTTYNQQQIVNRIFTVDRNVTNPTTDNLKKATLKDINSKLPEQLHIRGTMPNTFGFIPVVETTFKPTVDYSWQAKDRLAPARRIKGLQTLLNEGTKALRLELYLNRTKILADEDMINTGDKQALATLAEAGIIGILKDTGGIDGATKQIEVLQGNPKVSEYWENIANVMTLASSSLKLSELGETDSRSSATGEIFNKGNDVETANTLQTFRQESIAEILTKAWAMKKGESFTEDELDTSKWSVQLIPNVIMNEAKMTEIVIQQLGAGLINMTQALVKLEGISPSDAKNKLLEAQKEGAEIYNPTLEGVSAFGESDEENRESDKDKGKSDKDKGKSDKDKGKSDSKEQTTGSGKEVVEKK